MSITEKDLVYAASSRCPCGAGLAYQRECGPFGHWDCSAVLLGTADQNQKHTDKRPFIFWSIKSEDQPTAYGLTTRPVAK